MSDIVKVSAIDPGMETGLVEAILKDGKVGVVGRIQVQDGLAGLDEQAYLECLVDWGATHIVYEKFSPLPTARSYRLKELEPIRIEGAIEGYPFFGAELVPQRTSALTIAGTHGTPAKNKQAADNMLRECGLWTLPSELGRPDANDVNAAMKHLVAFGRSQGWPDPHEWTMEEL